MHKCCKDSLYKLRTQVRFKIHNTNIFIRQQWYPFLTIGPRVFALPRTLYKYFEAKVWEKQKREEKQQWTEW